MEWTTTEMGEQRLMNINMEKTEGEDGVTITIRAEPIKILSIEDGYVYCEWEGTRWRTPLPNVLTVAIMSDEIDEAMRDRFISRLRNILEMKGE